MTNKNGNPRADRLGRRSLTSKPKSPATKPVPGAPRKKQVKTGTPTKKSKNRTLKNQGCGTHNPSGGVKPPLQPAGHNKKPANGTGRPRAKETSVKQPLAGGECSRRGDQAAASTRDESIKNTLSPGGPRMPNEPSGQVAAPTQGTARVRFEFAGRAHRREFTPKLEIKRKENKVKEKEENFGQKRKKNSPQTAPKGAPKWKGAPSRTAPGSRGGTGREGLLGWRYCRDPSATHRKKRGSGVGRWQTRKVDGCSQDLSALRSRTASEGGRYRSRQIQEKTRTP